MQVCAGGAIVADTSAGLTRREAGYPPVHYVAFYPDRVEISEEAEQAA